MDRQFDLQSVCQKTFVLLWSVVFGTRHPQQSINPPYTKHNKAELVYVFLPLRFSVA